VRAHARRFPAGRIAYVDGRYVPHGEAGVHVEDRGLQFSDSIYEVCAIAGGRFLDEAGHLARLERSLNEIGMKMPMPGAALKTVMRETVRRNRVKDGMVYLQITRGALRREHQIPEHAQPTVIVTARTLDMQAIAKRRAEGIAVISRPDLRWGRCDIKSTGILPNVLVKTEARRNGAYEAWLVDKDGFVTEGTSTNAWIVTPEGRVVTRQLGNAILPGVTRANVIQALAQAQLTVDERTFRIEEAYGAREAFITAATAGALPVIRIDGRAIGEGRPGPVAARVHALYRAFAEHEAGL
jgi:D-alanine transaminase